MIRTTALAALSGALAVAIPAALVVTAQHAISRGQISEARNEQAEADLVSARVIYHSALDVGMHLQAMLDLAAKGCAEGHTQVCAKLPAIQAQLACIREHGTEPDAMQTCRLSRPLSGAQ